jgi:signal transduction histidine kinase
MIDRSRDTRTAELNDDRLQSLGRIASGLAHELNNPASAASRHAQSLAPLLTDAEHAARGLAAARLAAVFPLPKKRGAIKGRNPKDGTPYDVPAVMVAKVSVGKRFADAVALLPLR